MFSMLYIILTGFLVRADGWASADQKLKPYTDFFNAWPCGGLFGLLTLFMTGDALISLIAGLAFVLFRAPGFDGWQNWLNMFWRGWWTSAIGFSVLSCVAYGHPCFGLLSVPFSAIYMTTYAGGYKWLPEKILNFDRHVWIEHASGWVFGLVVLIILSA